MGYKLSRTGYRRWEIKIFVQYPAEQSPDLENTQLFAIFRVLSLATVRHFGDLKLLASISHSKKKKSPVINIE